MVDSLLWRDVRRVDVETLRSCPDPSVCKRLLGGYFSVDASAGAPREVLLERQWNNWSFARDRLVTAEKVSCFLSMMQRVLKEDCARGMESVDESFDRFKALVLSHAVERSPRSVGIFTRADVAAIVAFAVSSYFTQYRLYHTIFGTTAVDGASENGATATERSPRGAARFVGEKLAAARQAIASIDTDEWRSAVEGWTAAPDAEAADVALVAAAARLLGYRGSGPSRGGGSAPPNDAEWIAYVFSAPFFERLDAVGAVEIAALEADEVAEAQRAIVGLSSGDFGVGIGSVLLWLQAVLESASA
jgi:hypothetical protein